MIELNEKVINVLGANYIIKFVHDSESSTFLEDPDCGGFCSPLHKVIAIRRDKFGDPEQYTPIDIAAIKSIIRHEIIHAFLHESGLDEHGHSERNWAGNEEVVQWFALQGPKIFEVWKQYNLL